MKVQIGKRNNDKSLHNVIEKLYYIISNSVDHLTILIIDRHKMNVCPNYNANLNELCCLTP